MKIESNMGLAKLQFPRVVIHRPAFFVLYGGGAILALIAAIVLKNFWLVLLALPFILALGVYVRQLKGLFYDCDVNIAKVISRERKLYAVAMNLSSAGMPERLVVKIAKGHVPEVPEYDYPDGTYFPVICYPNYNKKPDQEDTVFTLPYTVGTSDPEKLKFQHDHIEPQIEDFEKCLAVVPKPYAPGLYQISLGE